MTRLGDRTWPELDGAPARTLLVPVGSCEQHGPHLPLDTDTRIAVAVADRVAVSRPDVVVAPAVAYGSSGEHQAFPGTLSIGTPALVEVLVELGRSAVPHAGFERLVFVNGHGGNHEAVERAVATLTGEGRAASAWWPSLPGADAHAGRTETSLLLAIAPALVRPERPVGETAPLAELLPRLRRDGTRPVTSNGVLGDATDASAAEGEDLLVTLVTSLGTALGAGPEPS